MLVTPPSSPATGARSWSAAALLAFAMLGCAHAVPVPCEALGRMPGPEDFDRLPPRGETALLVSSVERRGAASETATGSLLLVDARTGEVEPMPIHGRDACSFRPHGLSTVQRIGGAWEVYVVVHHGAGDLERDGCGLALAQQPAREPARARRREHVPVDSVERYRLHDEGLRFVERLTDPLVTNPNDVDAAPDGRLWVSNNPSWERPGQVVADLLLGRRRGQVLLYRPMEQSWSVAARRMLYPNWVAVDEAVQQLHVAAARGKLRQLPLDGMGHVEGRPIRRGRARGALDNLMWADDGALWTTGHPNGLAFMRHLKDAEAASPTEVLRITPDPKRRRRLAATRVLRVDDGRVDAGSVALPVADGVAIGQVFDAGVMLCRP
jgi:hypothetical protein